MRFLDTDVEDVVLVVGEPVADERGSFARIFSEEEFRRRGLKSSLVQANLATSLRAGTVRGLHYQLPPAAEAKLIRCITGAVFDVVVDLRRRSPTFGGWVGIELTAEEDMAVYVPPGCAHGYQALSPGSQVLYHVSAPYTPELERGVHHADPVIGISWPLPPVAVSAKDQDLPPVERAELPPS